MKYLKRYNIFESNDEIELECLDILREIQDYGYEVRQLGHYPNSISFYIYKPGALDFDVFWKGIEDVIERLRSYLIDCGFSIKWASPKERSEEMPTIRVSNIINPMTFEMVGIKTSCEINFRK